MVLAPSLHHIPNRKEGKTFGVCLRMVEASCCNLDVMAEVDIDRVDVED